jgi:hypothetical protein
VFLLLFIFLFFFTKNELLGRYELRQIEKPGILDQFCIAFEKMCFLVTWIRIRIGNKAGSGFKKKNTGSGS